MKVLVCYNDHEDSRYHKTVRITTPTPWGKKATAGTIIKKFIKSYNAGISKLDFLDKVNELNPDQVHLAFLESRTYIPIPIDVPITNCIPDETTMIHLRHGPSLPQAVLEAQQQDDDDDEEERDESCCAVVTYNNKKNNKNTTTNTTTKKKKVQHCARYGCMNEYNEKDPVFGPCLFHKAPPVFHVNEMYWACCPTKRVSKFTTLMKIRGCETAASCTLDDNLFLQEVNQVNDFCQYISSNETAIASRNKYTKVGVEICPTMNTKDIQDLVTVDDKNNKMVNGLDESKRLKYQRFKQQVANICKIIDESRDEIDNNDDNTTDSAVFRNTKSLVKFKKVLHSFGVDSMLYDHVIEGMKEDYELLGMDDERLNATIKSKLGNMLQQGFEAVAAQQTKKHVRGRRYKRNHKNRQTTPRKATTALPGNNTTSHKLEYNISEESSIIEEIELHPLVPYQQDAIEITTSTKMNKLVVPYIPYEEIVDDTKNKSSLVVFEEISTMNNSNGNDPLTKPNGLYSRLFSCTPPPTETSFINDPNNNRMDSDQLQYARNKSLILDNSDHAVDGNYFIDCLGGSSSSKNVLDNNKKNSSKKKSVKAINQRFYEKLQQQKQQYVSEQKVQQEQEYQEIQQPIRRLSLCGCNFAVTE